MKPQTFAFTVILLMAVAFGLVFTSRPPTPPPIPTPPAPQPTPRTFVVVGEGEVRVVPEFAVFRFALENTGPTIQAAQALNDGAYAVLIGRLISLSVEPADIEVLGRRVAPDGEDGDARRATLEMEVHLHHLDNLPLVRDAIALANPAHVDHIRYDVTDRDKALREALLQAMTDAREHAVTVASATGAKPAQAVQTVVLEPGPGPQLPLEYEAGHLTVRARVQVTYST